MACIECGSEYVLSDTKEIEFIDAEIPPEKNGYGGTMTFEMKISISWCMDCGVLLSTNYLTN